jgi:uncharacterized protein (TIGR03435 family)
MARHKLRARAVLIIFSLATAPLAISAQQTSTGGAAFEVATIKPAVDSKYSNINFNGQHFSAKNMPLRAVLQVAYDLNFESQIVNAPGWVESVRFDIDAKEDEATARKQAALPRDLAVEAYRPLIQALLADRFSLKVHHESREFPVLALVAAKGGAKLTPSNDAAAAEPDNAKPASSQSWQGLHNKNGAIEGRSVTLGMLASALGWRPEAAGRMVVDQTGLTGKYDFTLTWAPEGMPNADGPSLFTALQEQLGLKLEPTKAPVDILVIDHVEMPSAN